MFEELATAISTLEMIVAGLEPACLDGVFAARLVEQFARIERLGAAGKTLVAGRVEATGAWASSGDKSAADYLARVSGSSIGEAVGTLIAARSLEILPATAAAVRAGRLSGTQTRVITGAAKDAAGEEDRLLDSASRNGLAGLKADAEQVRLASQAALQRRQRQHRNRMLRRWRDSDGMRCGEYRLPETIGVLVDKTLDAAITKIFEQARSDKIRDSHAQYGADALASLITNAAKSSDDQTDDQTVPAATATVVYKVTVNSYIDYPALIRGELLPGEICEIPGAGPVSVETLQQYLADGALFNLIIKNGVDVTTIVRAGRYIPEPLAIALAARDRCCVTQRCHQTARLERNHRQRIDQHGPSSMANLDQCCEQCHDLISYHGYHHGPPDEHGKRPLIPPEPPPDTS